jgi:hypothetical protein
MLTADLRVGSYDLLHRASQQRQRPKRPDPRGPTHENEPHAFTVRVSLITAAMSMSSNLAEHEHADRAAHRDNNMRTAIIHVMADAAVSVIVIVGLSLGGGCSAGNGRTCREPDLEPS